MQSYTTVLISPPYGRLAVPKLLALPVAKLAADPSHVYLRVPNEILPIGLRLMDAWGVEYKSNIVCMHARDDEGEHFREQTEIVLFGVRKTGRGAFRTLRPWNRVNVFERPEDIYDLLERSSPGPRVEVFGSGGRNGWDAITIK